MSLTETLFRTERDAIITEDLIDQLSEAELLGGGPCYDSNTTDLYGSEEPPF